MEKTHKIDVVSIRLVEEPPLYSSKELKNPCDVAELFQDFLKDCDREMFCILNLRTKNQVINVNVVGMGTLNSVLVHPRAVSYTHLEGTTEPGSREKNHTGAKEVENRSNSEKEETVLGHVSYWWHSFRLWRLSLERVLSARKGYQLFFKPSGSGDGSPVCQLLERNFLKSNHFGDFCICDWYGHVCHQPEKLYAGTGIWYRCFCRSEKSGKAVCG